MSTNMLEARGLDKHFGALHVTRSVDLSVTAGARLALIGPNGAGKSTLVGLLTGQLKPDSGQILLAGRDVTSESIEKRTRSGLARTFQINNLFRGLTVLENVFLAVSERLGTAGSQLRTAKSCTEVIEKAEQLLKELELGNALHQRISEISYGRQRLVEIAIALSLSPRVLLLDEPTAGIPAGEVARVMEVLEALPAELAIVVIEHDMHVVRRFAKEIVVLAQGAVLARGLPQEVMASDEVRRVYLGGVDPSKSVMGKRRA